MPPCKPLLALPSTAWSGAFGPALAQVCHLPLCPAIAVNVDAVNVDAADIDAADVDAVDVDVIDLVGGLFPTLSAMCHVSWHAYPGPLLWGAWTSPGARCKQPDALPLLLLLAPP